jgi:hypothetical protein
MVGPNTIVSPSVNACARVVDAELAAFSTLSDPPPYAGGFLMKVAI